MLDLFEYGVATAEVANGKTSHWIAATIPMTHTCLKAAKERLPGGQLQQPTLPSQLVPPLGAGSPGNQDVRLARR